MKDLDSWPLGFIKPQGSSPLSHSRAHKTERPPYRSDDEYVIIPNMKKVDMLVFVASYVAHGSPSIGKNEEERFA
jgi:hypothetical protein